MVRRGAASRLLLLFLASAVQWSPGDCAGRAAAAGTTPSRGKVSGRRVFRTSPEQKTVPFAAVRPGRAKPSSRWGVVPRGGGGEEAADADSSAASSSSSSFSLATTCQDALTNLQSSLRGTKSDALLLLLVTSLVTPLCKAIGTSPILGFLGTGILFGPKGGNLIADVHAAEHLADIGIVLFLFEMGIHLNFATLWNMRADVFGLGLSQFLVTAAAVAAVAKTLDLSNAASIVLGGGLALSSSAFVLQLLKDKNQLRTEFGKSSFGVLLLQDLAVVPLLVATPILAGGGGDAGLGEALGSAAVQALIALTGIAFAGKFLLNPLFAAADKSESQEAFLGSILLTVLGMSFLTEGLGLSNTLGAFLAGVLLSDTPFRHRIEREINPFRGILVSLFFFTVGFEIDLKLITSKPGLVASVVFGIVVSKAIIATALCLAFDKGLPISQRCGLILSQGGEFAFLCFRTARDLGVLDEDVTNLMLTAVSLTMAITPFLEDWGGKFAEKLEGTEEGEVEDAKGRKKKKKN